jgi:hypothetical protein
MFYGTLFLMLMQYLVISSAMNYYEDFGNLVLKKIEYIYIVFCVFNLILLITFKVELIPILFTLLSNLLVFILIIKNQKSTPLLTNDMEFGFIRILILNKRLDLITFSGYVVGISIAIIRMRVVLESLFNGNIKLLVYILVLSIIASISCLYYYFKALKRIDRFFNSKK